MHKNRLASLTALATMFSAAVFMSGCAQMSAQNITTPTAQGGVAKPYSQSTMPQTIQYVGEADPETGSSTTWGAIATVEPENIKAPDRAISYAIIGFGITNNRATQQEAADAALTMCKNDGEPGCKVRYVFQGQCAAVFFTPDNRRAYGWAVALEIDDAAQMAHETCMQQNTGDRRDCVPFYASCPSAF